MSDSGKSGSSLKRLFKLSFGSKKKKVSADFSNELATVASHSELTSSSGALSAPSSPVSPNSLEAPPSQVQSSAATSNGSGPDGVMSPAEDYTLANGEQQQRDLTLQSFGTSNGNLSTTSLNSTKFDLEDSDVEDDLLYITDYTKEWIRQEDARELKFRPSRKQPSSLFESSKALGEISASRPLTDMSTKSLLKSQQQSGSTAPVTMDRKFVDEQMSSIRVFRRDGTFSTVSCPLSIPCSDLCVLLGRKFFFQNDTGSKYKLWLVRDGRETLIQSSDKPLRIQQQLLYEAGYDSQSDKLQEILREDNSYLFRWIYSETGTYESTVQSINARIRDSSSFKRDQLLTQYEQKVFDLIKISETESTSPDIFFTKAHLAGLNIDTIPLMFARRAAIIQTMDMSGNVMLESSLNFFHLCSCLTHLDFSRTQLKKVPVAISKLSSLQSLNLSHNLITTLKESNLDKLVYLQNLNLSCNHLLSKNSLPIEIVSAWKYLKTLNLSCNWLRKEFPYSLLFIGSGINVYPISLDQHAFAGDNPLQELDFSYNMIQILPTQFIQAFPNLKVLKLAGNNILKLPNTIIDLMQQLEIFDIRGNRIRGTVGSSMEVTVSTAPVESNGPLVSTNFSPVFADADTFDFQEQQQTTPSNNLKKLYLDNNHISDVKLNQRFENLEAIVSHRNPSLLQISFSQHMISLSTLVLSYARLAFLPDTLFTFTPCLKVLVLNNNQLTMLPPSIDALHNLIRLDLSENSITKLPSAIKEWTSLEILNLRANNLKELPSEIWLLNVKFLNLSSNTIEVWPEVPAPQITDQPTNNRNSSYMGNRARPTTIVASPTTESFSVDLSGGNEVPAPRRRASIIHSTQSNQNSFMGGIMPLSTSLQWLSIADNRLEASFFELAIFNMLSLRYLNVSHNEIFSIPNGTLRNSSPSLEELYLSGNHLTQLPDEVHVLKKLKRFFLNNNRIGSIPPELGKLSNLKQLDVGRNQLRYNVSNWPYDWNWNWNTDLHYLNLSGNPKLEIRSSAPLAGLNISKKGAVPPVTTDKGDIARFDSLKKLRSLGLMEVNLGVPIPEETDNLRIRVYAAGGASPNWKKHLGTETNPNADATPPVPKMPESATNLIGFTANSAPIVIVANENSLNTPQLISYGVADYLDLDEKSSSWDLVIVGAKIMQNVKDELKMAELKTNEESQGSPETVARVPRVRANTFRKKVGECLFGLFDGGSNGQSWCSKTLNDLFVSKFSSELKKTLKDSSTAAKRPASLFTGDLPITDSDHQIIESSLKRAFLALNKYFGDLYYKSKYKFKDSKDGQNDDPSKNKQPSRKQSVNFETSLLDGKPRKSGRKSIAPTLDDDDLQNTFTGATTDINFKQDEYEAGFDDYFNDHLRPDSSEEPYLRLRNHGYSALVAYVYNSQIYIANVGDVTAVISRNGVAVPVSIKHTAFNFQNIVCKPQVSANEANMNKEGQKKDQIPPKENVVEKAGLTARMESQNMFRAKKDLHRIRETGEEVSADSLVGGKTIFTRSFGYFEQAPQINAKPDIVTIDLTEQDEFLIIGTGSFWSNIQYQTAVDVARSKADDALEAAFALRDFAIAYSPGGSYIEDEETEFVDEKHVLKSKYKSNLNEKRFRRQDALSVMVINLRDFMSSSGNNKRKAFNKIKRKRDENSDSGIARLAPEVEAPTGNVALVFTDVRSSTSLWERMPIAMRVAIKEHNQIMRKNLRKFNGYEVKTEGDAFMVAFKNVIDAMGWCTEVQLQLLDADWPQEILEASDCQEIRGPASLNDEDLGFNQSSLLYRGLSVRMGIHYGNPVSEVDPVTRRMDYFGPMVNKSSRVSSSAEGGQIIISTDVEKAFRKQKLPFVKEEATTVDGKETLVFSYDPKDSANGQKTPGIFNVEPVLIHIGEKKLKGFEAPEPLISLFPKALVGRHRMGPPSLPGTEHVAIDNSKVEGLLNAKPAETPTSELSANSSRESISSQHSVETSPVTQNSMPRSIHSKFKLSALADINEEELSRSTEFRAASFKNLSTNPAVDADTEKLDSLCRRVEKVAFDLVKKFISGLLGEIESVDILNAHIKTRESSESAEEAVKRLERAASAIAFVKTSTIISEIKRKSRQEQVDFGNMLAMLLIQGKQ